MLFLDGSGDLQGERRGPDNLTKKKESGKSDSSRSLSFPLIAREGCKEEEARLTVETGGELPNVYLFGTFGTFEFFPVYGSETKLGIPITFIPLKKITFHSLKRTAFFFKFINHVTTCDRAFKDEKDVVPDSTVLTQERHVCCQISLQMTFEG